MSAIEKVGRIVRSRTAIGAAGLLTGSLIGANLPRGEHPVPPTPIPITRVSEPPRSTLTPFGTVPPIETVRPTPESPKFSKEKKLEDLSRALDGFFSNDFIGQNGLTSLTWLGESSYTNKVPYVARHYEDDKYFPHNTWWLAVRNPNQIVHFLDSQLVITSKHDKITDAVTETESIMWVDFDKVPRMVQFTSKNKRGYFTLPQDKLREFVDASGIFSKTFTNNLKSFTWENFTKKNSYDEGVEDMPAVRAKGKIGNVTVELVVDAEGVVVLRTKK